MSVDWYDRDGNKIDVAQADKYLGDIEYRRVGYDIVIVDDEPVLVSTVLLCLDHNWSGHGPPEIFETMTFGGDENAQNMWRYSTLEQARNGHHRIVRALTEGRSPDEHAERVEAEADEAE